MIKRKEKENVKGNEKGEIKVKKIKPAKGERPKMEKKKKRRIITISAAGVIVLFLVVNSAFAKSAALPVSVTGVLRSDIEETLSTSGMIESDEVKTYFSKITGAVGELYVQAGDEVKSGSQLIAFDEKSVEFIEKQAELQAKANEGSYLNTVETAAENSGKLSEAETNLKVLTQQIEDEENYIKELEAELTELQANLSAYYNQAATNISIYGIQLQSDLEKATAEQNAGEVERLKEEIKNNSIAGQQVSYQLGQMSNDSRVKELQDKIAQEQDKLTGYQEYKAEMEGQKNTSEGGVLNEHQKSELEANHGITVINDEVAKEDSDFAKQGVVADFNGIVMAVNVVNGGTVTDGTELLTLANSDKVKVKISVTKYDLEKLALGQQAEITVSGHSYEGEVTKIDRMAVQNSSGTPVVGVEVSILNPDENIYLGIEAKVDIRTQKSEQTLCLPVECVNADKEGDFVYVVEEGSVIRKNVVTGISSDTYIEVKEGVTEGEQVVSSITTGIVEGMAVTAIPAQ